MIIDITTILPFGKYKGESIETLFNRISKREANSLINYFNWVEKKTQHSLTIKANLYLEGIVDYFALRISSYSSKPKSDLYLSDRIDGNNPCAFIH